MLTRYCLHGICATISSWEGFIRFEWEGREIIMMDDAGADDVGSKPHSWSMVAQEVRQRPFLKSPLSDAMPYHDLIHHEQVGYLTGGYFSNQIPLEGWQRRTMGHLALSPISYRILSCKHTASFTIAFATVFFSEELSPSPLLHQMLYCVLLPHHRWGHGESQHSGYDDVTKHDFCDTKLKALPIIRFFYCYHYPH